MEYLIVISVQAYRTSPRTFAIESAFAVHLRMLKAKLGPRFSRLVLAAPTFDRDEYETNRGHMLEIDEVGEGISLEPLYPVSAALLEYWGRHFPRMLGTIWEATARASLVHTGLSYAFWRPAAFSALVIATLQRKPAIFVVDIDYRNSARMFYESGVWSRKSYLICRYLYDPLRAAQIRFAAGSGALCLFKGRKLVADYGRGRPNVRNFYDTAFSAEHVIPARRLEQKLARLRDPAAPLRLVYFGRLTAYKGVDRAIRAVGLALERGGRPLELHVIGGGEERPALEALVATLGLERTVHFHHAIPYGPKLFDALEGYDLSVATPLAEDTPRSAFDAFATGLPIVAFDTTYFTDLAESGAVATSPWPSPEAMAELIVELDADRPRLETMARAAVQFARANTQEIWLDRRVAWTFETLGQTVEAPPVVVEAPPVTVAPRPEPVV